LVLRHAHSDRGDLVKGLDFTIWFLSIQSATTIEWYEGIVYREDTSTQPLAAQEIRTMLGAELRRYLNECRTARASPALTFMDIMACKLFQAIRSGLTLRCGCLPGRLGSGIFIKRQWELDQPMHVLTTWQPSKRGTDDVGNAVSLRVGVCANRVVDPSGGSMEWCSSPATLLMMSYSAGRDHGSDN
jgi:hypothetical protein